MAATTRLQDPITVSADTKQDKRDAVDVAEFKEVAVQVNVLVAGNGTLALEHAAVLSDNQFEAIGNTVSLGTAGPKTVLITGHTRYLRWKTTSMAGTATFQIDLVGR